MPIAAAGLILAGCGSAPKKGEGPAQPGTVGKYYSNDGPPDSVPVDLASVPEATPRDEPFHRFANRPYTVFGHTYVPVVSKEATRERGIASWYGKMFHGRKTASGEIYDMFAMTAAHKTLPIPSFARVTNLQNGKSVIVRVNDRGPFHAGRVIDLSYAAAMRIGIAAAGSGMVEVERVLAPTDVVAVAPVAPPAMADVVTPIVQQDATALWLQLGAFASAENAEAFRTRAAASLTWNLEPLDVAVRDGLYRVRLGPYRNPAEAAAIADKVRESLGFAPAIHR